MEQRHRSISSRIGKELDIFVGWKKIFRLRKKFKNCWTGNSEPGSLSNSELHIRVWHWTLRHESSNFPLSGITNSIFISLNNWNIRFNVDQLINYWYMIWSLITVGRQRTCRPCGLIWSVADKWGRQLKNCLPSLPQCWLTSQRCSSLRRLCHVTGHLPLQTCKTYHMSDDWGWKAIVRLFIFCVFFWKNRTEIRVLVKILFTFEKNRTKIRKKWKCFMKNASQILQMIFQSTLWALVQNHTVNEQVLCYNVG